MQINSITNNFNINTQNRNYFSKNESHVAFGSREDVLGYTSKIALKHIDEKNLYKAKVKNIIKDAIKNCDVEILFEAVGLKAKRDLFGKYTVSGYGKGGGATHDFSELGVDENKLFKKIKRITGTADFRASNATDLGSLKQIDGDLWLSYDKRTPQEGYFDFITHNGKTKYFDSKPCTPESNTTSNLEIIKDAIKNGDVERLFEAVGLKTKRDSHGKYIVSGYGKGGGATHDFSELGVDENKLLKKIKRITGTADFRESNATDLGSLKQIDGDLWLSYDKRTPQWGYFDFITHNGKTKHFDSKPCIPGSYTTSNLDYPPSYYDHEWKPRPEDYRPSIFF